MSIKENLIEINRKLPPTTKLVAVSKYYPIEVVMQAYDAGHRIFGESRPQELKEKAEAMPKDIEWHFIGHLQTNKIKMVVPYAALIHSVDSDHLALEIEKYCLAHDLRTEILLLVHIAQEQTKQGFSEEDLFAFLDEVEQRGSLERVEIIGLMAMASFNQGTALIDAEFAHCKRMFDKVVSLNYSFLKGFDQLSMGMSGDYRAAVHHGSSLVRVGRSIFGQ